MTTPARKAVALAVAPALLTFAVAALMPPIAAQEAARPKSSPAKVKTTRKAVEDDEAPKAKAKSARTTRPSRRLPIYYGGLSLTDEQKESIYDLEAKYQPEIQDLEKQADALRERLASECEDVLTAAQKRALADARQSASDRRKAAAERRKSEADADAEDESAEAKAEPAARKPATID